MVVQGTKQPPPPPKRGTAQTHASVSAWTGTKQADLCEQDLTNVITRACAVNCRSLRCGGGGVCHSWEHHLLKRHCSLMLFKWSWSCAQMGVGWGTEVNPSASGFRTGSAILWKLGGNQLLHDCQLETSLQFICQEQFSLFQVFFLGRLHYLFHFLSLSLQEGETC